MAYYNKADIKRIMMLVRNKKMGVSEATNRMVNNAQSSEPLKRN